MKSIISKLNIFFVLVLFIGIFFASARIITHLNSTVENHQHNNFLKKYITIKKTYQSYRDDVLDGAVCEKIENREIHRHHLRWVFEKTRLLVFDQFEHNNNGKNLSYIYSMMLAILISLSFLFSILTVNKNIYNYINRNKHNFIFLFLIFFFIISFYSFRVVGELRYSFFEMFFLSIALFSSIKKQRLLFLITVILATLNRESGILISSIWFIINGIQIKNKKINLSYKDTIYGLIFVILSILSLMVVNYEIFSCDLTLEFLSYKDPYTLPVFNKSIVRNLNIIFSNFFVIILLLYFFYIDFEKQFKLILIILFYNIVFLLFTPADNAVLRIMFAPIFVLYAYEYLVYKNVKEKL